MKNNRSHRLTLDRPVKYCIKVPGKPDSKWFDFVPNMTISFETDQDGMPVSIITGVFDQSALQGFLRYLYALGMPLLSVLYLGVERDIETDKSDAN